MPARDADVIALVFPSRQGILWHCSQFLVSFRSYTFAVQFTPRLIPLQELATRPEWGDAPALPGSGGYWVALVARRAFASSAETIFGNFLSRAA